MPKLSRLGRLGFERREITVSQSPCLRRLPDLTG